MSDMCKSLGSDSVRFEEVASLIYNEDRVTNVLKFRGYFGHEMKKNESKLSEMDSFYSI